MQLHWHTEPLLLISLLLVGWLYALGTGPLRGRIAPKVRYPTAKAVLFYSGLILTYIAVGSPIDQLGEEFLFSAHMVQHMLLIYCTTTLFIFGTPSWLIDHLLKPRLMRNILMFLTHPACGGLLFTVVYTAWHVPALYELALRDKAIHVLEHWTMFGLGLLMLWPYITLSKLVPRRSFAVRMIGMFLLMVGQLPVFAFLTLAGEALYPTYIWAPRIIDLDPMNDQILGGIIMKVINMGFSLTILGTTFYAWSKFEETSPDTPIDSKPNTA